MTKTEQDIINDDPVAVMTRHRNWEGEKDGFGPGYWCVACLTFSEARPCLAYRLAARLAAAPEVADA